MQLNQGNYKNKHANLKRFLRFAIPSVIFYKKRESKLYIDISHIHLFKYANN